MFLVDTNILIYAADRGSDAHLKCRSLLDQWRKEISPWYLTWSIVYEFLRVTTHPRVFPKPWRLDDSWSFIEALLASKSLTVLTETENHQEHLAKIIKGQVKMRGNLLHDAHIVALMAEYGIQVIYTRDTDFHKFPQIEVRDPIRSE